MKKVSWLIVEIIFLLFHFVIYSSARAEVEILGDQAILSGEVDFGIQGVGISGKKDSKFEEYRDIPEYPVLNSFDFKLEGKEKPYYLEIGGVDFLQKDEYYFFRAGKWGRFRLEFEWDRVPHRFANEATFVLHRVGDGKYAISDTTQAAFEAQDPLPDTPASITNTAALARTLVAGGESIDLRLERRIGRANFHYTPTENWTFDGSLILERRKGTRPIGTGTYERVGTAVGDTFKVLGIELPETIDYKTYDGNFGINFGRKDWTLNLQYHFSFFNNEIEALEWDNPFRLTDLDSATNRGRFQMGRLNLPPDNSANDVSLSGTVLLPHKTKFTGTISYGRFSQNETFLPYTSNSAIIATNVTGTPPALTLARPQKDLNGDVKTWFQNYLLTNQMIKNVTINTFYRFYDFDNNSDTILFPGYAAFGESAWRTTISPSAGLNFPVLSEPISFRKQNAGIGGIWRTIPMLFLKMNYEFERWERENRNIKDSDEHIVGGSVQLKPKTWWDLRLGYRYGNRKIGEYDPELEMADLRQFDQSDRKRHFADILLNIFPMENLTATLSSSYGVDRYDETSYGLRRNNQYSSALDITYSPLHWMSFFGHYSYERYVAEMRSLSKTATVTTGNTWRNATNTTWDSKIKDNVHNFGLGGNFTFIPKKLELQTSYNLTYAIGDIETRNPFGVPANAVLNATAFGWPSTSSRLHELKTSLSYHISKNFTVGAAYLFEKFDISDYALDIMQPYMFGITADDSLRYLFLNVRIDDYRAHVIGGFLKIRF